MGAGYTRQALANIANGLTIFAVDINNELNSVQSAFNGVSGHAHDGSIGNGPKIGLTTSVTGILPVANGGSGGINNYTATSAPTVNSDTTQSYAVGSKWINITSGDIYVCKDATTGAAVWIRQQNYSTNLASIAGLTMTTNSLAYATGAGTFAVTSFTPLAQSLVGGTTTASMQSTLALVPGTNVQAYSANLSALSSYNTNGILVQTAANTFAGRSIAGTGNQITVTNGDGVAGNPTLSLPTSLTFTGFTITNGTFSSPTINSATISSPTITSGTWSSGSITTTSITASGGSITGVTLNNGVIGGVTPANGTFTNLTANTTAILSGADIVTAASTTGGANFTMPHGVAPTVPANGDFWTTTTGLFGRINGTTLQYATLTGTETLTNKTISGGSISGLSSAIPVASGGTGATTLTGLIKGSGTSALSAATAGTDYYNPGGTKIAVADGGTNIGSYTAGDLLYASGATTLSKLGKGSTNQVLQTGTTPSWTTIPFVQSFESAQQIITNGGLIQVAHGLGTTPKLYAAYLQCVTAEGGYSIGMEIPLTNQQGGTNNYSPTSLVPDATNLNLRYSSSGTYLNSFANGNSFPITNANWKVVLRAWA